MNDCSRQNPAYRLTLNFCLPPITLGSLRLRCFRFQNLVKNFLFFQCLWLFRGYVVDSVRIGTIVLNWEKVEKVGELLRVVQP